MDFSDHPFIPLIMCLVLLLIYIPPIVAIIRKAGYSGWFVLLGFVPLVNLVMFWVFAFSSWPALRRASSQEEPAPHPLRE